MRSDARIFRVSQRPRVPLCCLPTPPRPLPRFPRARLRRLADIYATLPDAAAELAADVLEAMTRRMDPAAAALALADYDDEPLTDADRAAIAEGQAEYDRGEYRELADVCAELGITPEALAAAERELDAGHPGAPRRPGPGAWR